MGGQAESCTSAPAFRGISSPCRPDRRPDSVGSSEEVQVKLVGLRLTVLLTVATAVVFPAAAAADVIVPTTYTVTCTFDPHSSYVPEYDIGVSPNAALTTCVVFTQRERWEDPICIDGTLTQFGLITITSRTDIYLGRAIVPSNDGVVIVTSDDPGDVLLRGARLLDTPRADGHTGPVTRVLGSC